MSQAGSTYPEARDIWHDHHKQQQFEHQLIDRKTTWLLTSQSILFAAYGVSFTSQRIDADDADYFRRVVTIAGLTIASLILIGVLTLIYSKWRSWRDYREFYRGHPAFGPPRQHTDRSLQWGVRTPNTAGTLIPDVFLPIAFIGSWAALAMHTF